MSLHGITVKLYTQTQTGKDSLNRPVYAETAVDVENVLVGQPTSTEVLDTLNLTGKKAVYTLGIPKGDTHDWTDKKVQFMDAPWNGMTFRTIGVPIMGIEDMIPLRWNKQVKVEAYE